MTRDACLTRLSDAKQRLDELLAGLASWEAADPDGWTPKDHLAHISAWHRRLLTWMAEDAAGRAPERPEPGYVMDQVDELNERDWRASRDTPLDDVQREFEQSSADVVDLVRSLSDADLTDANRYSWLPDWPLWHVVASNSFDHYDEHVEMLERLRN